MSRKKYERAATYLQIPCLFLKLSFVTDSYGEAGEGAAQQLLSIPTEFGALNFTICKTAAYMYETTYIFSGKYPSVADILQP